MPPKPLERGRRTYDRRAWKDAHELLGLADRESALRPADLERLATAAFLIGREQEFERETTSPEAWVQGVPPAHPPGRARIPECGRSRLDGRDRLNRVARPAISLVERSRLTSPGVRAGREGEPGGLPGPMLRGSPFQHG